MGHAGYIGRAQKDKRNYHRRKSLGLCPKCINKAIPGEVYCIKHKEKARFFDRNRKNYYYNSKVLEKKSLRNI